jgi:hypothetical protein
MSGYLQRNKTIQSKVSAEVPEPAAKSYFVKNKKNKNGEGNGKKDRR